MTETMPAEVAESLASFCESRGGVYALLSRCFEKELDAAFIEALQAEGAFESDDATLTERFTALRDNLTTCDEAALEELAVVFNRVFFGMGPRTAQKAFPYESVYTSEKGLMMQDAFSEVKKFYRTAGFEKAAGFTEPEDHLAIELAFMARLADQAAAALREGNEEAAEQLIAKQQEFLHTHLLNWTSPFFTEVRSAAEGGFYADLASFAEAYLRADAEALTEVLE